MSGPAKYSGHCTECEDRIEAGDEVAFIGDQVVHVNCEAKTERPRTICGTCWMEQPCGCEDE